MRTNKDICDIQVNKFRAYHPRADYKSMPWIKIYCNIYDDHVWSRLPAHSMSFWIYLLTFCGRLNADRVTIGIRLAATAVRLKPNQVSLIIDSLEENQMVTVHSRSWDVRLPSAREGKISKGKVRLEERRVGDVAAEAAPPPVAAEQPKSHWLIDIWNEHGAKLPKARVPISPSRLRKIQTRVKQNPDHEIWIEGIKRIAASDFCNGLNDRSWIASFDWLLKPETLDKILEGKYDNRPLLDRKSIHWASQAQRIERGEI